MLFVRSGLASWPINAVSLPEFMSSLAYSAGADLGFVTSGFRCIGTFNLNFGALSAHWTNFIGFRPAIRSQHLSAGDPAGISLFEYL